MPSADLKKPLGTGEQTMSRDKQQIELERWEMAESLAKNFHINGEGWDASDFEWAAHCQEEGYRKASYVAREIFDDIERLMFAYRFFTLEGVYYHKDLKDALADLKKKYESEGSDDE